jgi:branched-chain amino acid transport system substrate-binding protein
MSRMRVLAATWAAAMTWVLSAGDVVGGPKPIKVGFSMALTGAIAVNGKQLLAALEIWRDDVNAHGACWAVRWSLFATMTRAIRRTCLACISS